MHINRIRQSDSESARNAQPTTQGAPSQRGWQRVALSAFGAIGTVALLGLAACPADLENPERFDIAGAGTGTGGSAQAGAPGVQPGLNVDTTCVAQAFANGCATAGICHKAGDMAGAGLDLESPGFNKRIIDVVASHKDANPNTGCVAGQKLVNSADPANSWLGLKISKSAEELNNCGSAMPVGPALSAADKACILKYIQDVAAAATAGN